MVARRDDGARQRVLRLAALLARSLRRVREIPVVGRADAVRERRLRVPAERAQLADVEQLARRAVGLAAVEDERAAEADDLGDQLRELGDRDVLAAADVDDLGRVVALHEEQQASARSST